MMNSRLRGYDNAMSAFADGFGAAGGIGVLRLVWWCGEKILRSARGGLRESMVLRGASLNRKWPQRIEIAGWSRRIRQ
jgi:hypothetical protein